MAGLANGLFLLFIALFIMKEAIERTFEPPEVHHERLFVISVLGFIVNLVGIFVFQHGGQGHHHHGHGGCSHSHSHSSKAESHNHTHTSDHGYNHYSSPTIVHNNNNNYNNKHQVGGVVALDMNGYSPAQNNNIEFQNNSIRNNHQHEHHHHHHEHHDHHNDHEPLILEPIQRNTKSSGRGQIMQSVFLHIVADTLGSVGVMVSAVLMNQFGWMIADPLCSLFIAILISVSVFPLLQDSFYVLMQRIPVELEDKLPACINRIKNITGVLSVHETHFWTLNSDTYIGCLKLEAAQGADLKFISSNAKVLLNQLGVEKVHIQIDQV